MHGHREGLLDSNQLSSIDILVLRQERARQRVKQPANHNCVMICSVLESLATSHQATSLVSLMHKSSQRLTSNRKLTTSNHSRHTCSSGYFAILANRCHLMVFSIIHSTVHMQQILAVLAELQKDWNYLLILHKRIYRYPFRLTIIVQLE